MTNLIEKIIGKNTQAPKPIGAADRECLRVQAHFIKEAADTADRNRLAALEAQAVAADKATAAKRLEEFLKSKPNQFEVSIFHAQEVVRQAERVVERSPKLLTKVLFDGSTGPHQNVSALRAAQATLRREIEKFERFNLIRRNPPSTLNPTGPNLQTEYLQRKG